MKNKKRICITIGHDNLKELDETVAKIKFADRSRVIEELIVEWLKSCRQIED